MNQAFSVYLDVEFVTEKVLQELRRRFKIFLDQNKADFTGDFNILAKEFESPLKVRVQWWLEHNYNLSQDHRWKPDGSLVVMQIASDLRAVGAKYTGVHKGDIKIKNE